MVKKNQGNPLTYTSVAGLSSSSESMHKEEIGRECSERQYYSITARRGCGGGGEGRHVRKRTYLESQFSSWSQPVSFLVLPWVSSVWEKRGKINQKIGGKEEQETKSAESIQRESLDAQGH